MYAETEGRDTAPPLVLLHGGIGTGRYHWSKLVATLAERWQVHLPDLPGHGRTPLPADGTYSRDVLAGAVAAYLAALDGPAHVGAFSMGGHAALAVAGARPQLFASLTLVGVSVRDHDGLRVWRDNFRPERLEREYPVWARHLAALHAPQGSDEAWRDVCRRDAGGLDVAVDVEGLAGLRCPVLLVRGDRDPAVDPAHYGELRRVWPQADEFVVPAGRHDVQLTRHRVMGPGFSDFLRRAPGG
ncbi:MAG TPA: alpha/beta fold hydrolase [Egibacteraceae bacterium]|nr:alpha/beta fold hydrolase [Egibacteraceae bacterium]